MSGVALSAGDIAALRALTSVLIPAAGDMPAAIDLAGLDDRLHVAVRACGYADTDIVTALREIPDGIDFDSARRLAATDADGFHILSTLITAAYYMSPPVLDAIGYPVAREHPAEVEDFMNEYETGVLDAVIERGSCYRVTDGIPA